MWEAWTSLGCAGQGWTGLGCAGQGWTSLGCNCLGCTGLGCTGLGRWGLGRWGLGRGRSDQIDSAGSIIRPRSGRGPSERWRRFHTLRAFKNTFSQLLRARML